MKLEILVVFAALAACVAYVIWGVETMRANNAREREAQRAQCASKGGHLHCPYRAECLCLAPGMVVP